VVAMRGRVEQQDSMLSLMTPARRVPKDHPIRRIKEIADRELERLSPVFEKMYDERGRYSIPPETLLKSLLLVALYSVRSERQFCERLQYDLLFRFFLDMGIEEDAFDHSTFTKNRDRLMAHEVAQRFFEGVVEHARGQRLISSEHFTVDGTLIEAWASLKSVRPKEEKPEDREPPDDRSNPTVNFHGERRTNETHASTTDAEARLARKGVGKEAKLCFSGHVLMENRSGLCVDVSVARATGTAEREEALFLLGRLQDRGFRPRTLGADKGYDVASFVHTVQAAGVTPHVAQNTSGRRSNIDGRTTRHAGYATSQRIRKRVEEIFGWAKTVGGLRRTRYRGLARTAFWTFIVGAAYNLVRMTRLMLQATT
jgi:transposase